MYEDLYSPGQPNWEFLLFVLAIFLPLRFYEKSILADIRKSKTASLIILMAWNFDFWNDFTPENVRRSQKYKILSCLKGQNGSFWGLKRPKLISRKNWVAEKSWDLQIVYSHFPIPIRLPWSVFTSQKARSLILLL